MKKKKTFPSIFHNHILTPKKTLRIQLNKKTKKLYNLLNLLFSGREHPKIITDSENGIDLVFKKFILDIMKISEILPATLTKVICLQSGLNRVIFLFLKFLH